MKIAIGTANFGAAYGINKKYKSLIKKSSIAKILKFAKKHNITTIDTAINYKNSEKILGSFDLTKFEIITKLTLPKKKIKNIELWIRTKIQNSLKRLRIKKLYAVLIHNSDIFLNNNSKKIIYALEELQKEKLIDKIGVSIYNPYDLKKILKIFKSAKIVQCPLNLLDRKIINSGWINKLYKNNIELHVRSVFLQGLLLMDIKKIPNKFRPWINIFENLEKWHMNRNIKIYDTCIKFVSQHSKISKIIFGIDNEHQLKQIYQVYKNKKKFKFPKIQSYNNQLIYPFNW